MKGLWGCPVVSQWRRSGWGRVAKGKKNLQIFAINSIYRGEQGKRGVYLTLPWIQLDPTEGILGIKGILSQNFGCWGYCAQGFVIAGWRWEGPEIHPPKNPVNSHI